MVTYVCVCVREREKEREREIERKRERVLVYYHYRDDESLGSGADPIKKFWSNFTHSVCKLDHFSAMKKIALRYKMV
jgi:hypothetical protein